MEPPACLFCSPDNKEIVIKNEFWYARWDKYPVSKGHLLLIPFRHVQNCFNTTQEEKNALFPLLEAAKEILDQTYSADGYNIGTNIGWVAGQSVMHCHIHIIPRYAGDTDHPRGGVRRVIPEKGGY